MDLAALVAELRRIGVAELSLRLVSPPPHGASSQPSAASVHATPDPDEHARAARIAGVHAREAADHAWSGVVPGDAELLMREVDAHLEARERGAPESSDEADP